MKKWINRFRLIKHTDEFPESEFPNGVLGAFECSCPPESRSHERMVSGALINMGNHVWLDDGVAQPES